MVGRSWASLPTTASVVVVVVVVHFAYSLRESVELSDAQAFRKL